jgi:UDP-GlcNAc:undecaprenyl-phosphate GlcNAc-1-phosphate transferase
MIYVLKASLVFLTTLIGTLFILPKLMHIASTWIVTEEGSFNKRYRLMDFPDNHRKVHDVPKPLVGGLGMLIMVSLSSVLFVPPSDLNLRGYYSAVIMLGIVGFLDDFRELHYRWKFVAQIVAATVMIHYSRNALLSFGDLLSFGSINLGIFIAPVTIFCTLGVINAINMIDGLDGLAGGISLIAFISFTILAYVNRQFEIMLLSLSLSGAVIGFLRYNWYPSKLFMGDAGSFFLGFSLAFLSIAITQTRSDNLVPPVAALLILAVPIVDTITVMVRRMIKGKSPFTADQNHLHHILLRLGLNIRGTVIAILSLSLVFSSFAVVGTIFRIPEYYLFLVFSVYFILYFFLALFCIKDA